MWGEECRTEKKVLIRKIIRKIIRKLKKRERNGEKYKETRKEYRELCEKKERRIKGGLREQWKLKERVRRGRL